jgi:hypothetical protein
MSDTPVIYKDVVFGDVDALRPVAQRVRHPLYTQRVRLRVAESVEVFAEQDNSILISHVDSKVTHVFLSCWLIVHRRQQEQCDGERSQLHAPEYVPQKLFLCPVVAVH